MCRLLSYRFVALAVGVLWVVSVSRGNLFAATDPTGPAVPPTASADPADPFSGSAASPPRTITKDAGPRVRGRRPFPVGQPTNPSTPADNEARIKRELDAQTQIEFVETPLKEVVDYLKDLHHIEILLDTAALKQVGVDESTPVTKNLKSISLRSALQLLLAEISDDKLTFVIDEVLLITSKAKAENVRMTKVYDVADLVTCQDSKAKFWDDYDTLTNMIQETVCRQSWALNGGQGTIQGASLDEARVLVVWQTKQVHEEIAALLKGIRAVSAKKRVEGKAGSPQRDPPKRTAVGRLRFDVLPNAAPITVPPAEHRQSDSVGRHGSRSSALGGHN